MSNKRGEKVSDEHVRHYIKNLAAKRGEGSDVSVEHLRKKFGIGYKRAKRLHDDELGPTNDPSKPKPTPKRYASEVVSDETVLAFIQKCLEEGRDISTNELRHELHIGYKRAIRLLTQSEKSPRKRLSLSEQGVDELAALNQSNPSKRPRRGQKRAEEEPSIEDKQDDDQGVEGLEEEHKLDGSDTLDEGQEGETNGDGLLEFTDVVLNLPKGGGWEDTLQGFEGQG
jgi:DNA segregation ATPase FtsK/SpoIIIE-like protein